MNARELIPIHQFPLIETKTALRLAAAVSRIPNLISHANAASFFELEAGLIAEKRFKPQHRIFHHRLSDAVCAKGGDFMPRPSRLSEEVVLYQRIRDEYRLSLNNCGTTFARFVSRSGSAFVSSHNVLRARRMFLKSDKKKEIELPLAKYIPVRLAEIGKILSVAPSVSPLMRAIWVYVLFLNLHPLCDGNGRLARILFNCELYHHGAPADAYIPISLVMAGARGGYEIRLRQAEIFGQWDPIINFFACMIEMCSYAGPNEVAKCE